MQIEWEATKSFDKVKPENTTASASFIQSLLVTAEALFDEYRLFAAVLQMTYI